MLFVKKKPKKAQEKVFAWLQVLLDVISHWLNNVPQPTSSWPLMQSEIPSHLLLILRHWPSAHRNWSKEHTLITPIFEVASCHYIM